MSDISERLAAVIDRVAKTESRTPAAIHTILSEANLTQEDVEPFCDWDHPAGDCYGRAMVYDGGEFEVMVMSWVPGDISAIHDHGSTRWGAVQLFGRAEHSVFALDGDRLTTVARESMAPGTVLPVAHELIHQMGNFGEDNYATIHIYGCDGAKGHITAGARIFDVDEGAIQLVDGGAFFDLTPGTYEIERKGLRAGFATHLRHQSELAARIARKHAAVARGELRCERGRRVARELFSKTLWSQAPETGELSSRDAAILDREVARAAIVMGELAALVDDECPQVTEDAPCPVEEGVEGFARPFVEHVTAAVG